MPQSTQNENNRRLHLGLAVEDAGRVTRKALFSLPLPRWGKTEPQAGPEKAGSWYLVFLLVLPVIVQAVQRYFSL